MYGGRATLARAEQLLVVFAALARARVVLVVWSAVQCGAHSMLTFVHAFVDTLVHCNLSCWAVLGVAAIAC
jgi:hypothetical protein